MENIKIIQGGESSFRNWWVEIEQNDEIKVWNFKRREYLDVNGNPVYEIYPPYQDVINGLFNAGVIGRRNVRREYYSSNGYGAIENIKHEKTAEKLSKNTDLKHIFEDFYNQKGAK